MLEEIYCFVDDFYKAYAHTIHKSLINNGKKKRNKLSKLSPPEVITILILFNQSNYRTLKHFYLGHVVKYMKAAFPALVSYTRFVELQKQALIYIASLSKCFASEKTGFYFIDSTPIEVCHIKREKQHKVLSAIAEKSCSTKGYYYGLKLHLVINDKGEIINFKLTSSKTDDRLPVELLAEGLTGRLIGDKGYISKAMTSRLMAKGLQLITKVRKNMKAVTLSAFNKALLRKRAIIETVNDQLKNISQIEHTRHRSIYNFMTNLLAGICAYNFKEKKPSLDISARNLIEQM